ncbi:MAG: hypothetical protein ACP5N0_12365 [Methanosarcina sp.]|uniref:hypothetical protein n=1 Tax=Methanosarcina sp. TaxID=2213 RepID=UPI003BB5164A
MYTAENLEIKSDKTDKMQIVSQGKCHRTKKLHGGKAGTSLCRRFQGTADPDR